MRSLTLLCVTALCAACIVALPSRPKKGTGADRVHDSQPSDEAHHAGSEHNSNYDHDAFLGSEEAKKFQALTPEQSRERLR